MLDWIENLSTKLTGWEFVFTYVFVGLGLRDLLVTIIRGELKN